MYEQQFRKMRSAPGFIAALDQSGGSTPRTLERYGTDTWADETEMFDLVHGYRTRIMRSPAFTGGRILGSILFVDTMDRQVEGRPTPEFLWEVKNIVPIVKVDKGLADEHGGARLMKPIPGLDELLLRARHLGVFGTKMRSVIAMPGPGVEDAVDQQIELGRHIAAAGLVPILEPEVDITSPEKAAAEQQVHDGLVERLDELSEDEHVMLKLTLPERDGLYDDLVSHPRVLRVFALSGGYSRAEAAHRLARQHGVVASFARAFMEGLQVTQSDDEFDAMLDSSIAEIFTASVT